MRTKFKTFRERIEQGLNPGKMCLPAGRVASHFRASANRDYRSIRVSWKHAKAALKYEISLVKRLENASDVGQEIDRISDEMWENQIYEDESQLLLGLDIGVASAVLTLSAMGCVTVTSCNGGCFGDFHHEIHPLVVFYAKPELAALLLKAAKKSGVGIGHTESGLMVWANDIREMLGFATEIIKGHEDLRKKRRTGGIGR